MIKDIDCISAKDSNLTSQQIQKTIAMLKQWIAEHYWEFDSGMDQTIQNMESSIPMQIQVAQSIQEAFEQTDRTPASFERVLEQAALLLPSLNQD